MLHPYLVAGLDLAPLDSASLHALYENACGVSALTYQHGLSGASNVADHHADRIEAELSARGLI